MPTVNQGWAFVSGSGDTTAGGSNTQIQFNNAGNLAGSSNLTWDGSQVATVNISASTHISASGFTGDGRNLTNVTASAVEVADGPEFSIQFRKDTPISGEISGSSDLMWKTTYLQVTGAVKVAGEISASTSVSASEFYVAGETIYFGAGNTYKIGRSGTNLDINSGGNINLNAGSGHVSASTNFSASQLYGNQLVVPDGGNIGSTSKPNLVYLQSGTFQVDGDIEAGAGPGNETVRLRASGEVSGSGRAIFGSIQTSGNVTFDGELTASAGILANVNPTAGPPGLWLSASNPAFGPGKVYGNLWFGSGSNPGTGFTGAAIGLSNFGAGTEFEFRSKEGGATFRSDGGDTVVRATAGEVLLSGSDGVVVQTTADFNSASTFNNDSATFNAGATFNNTTATFNAGINSNNTVATFNAGLNANDTATFNSNLNAYANTTIGNAHSDNLEVNASASFNNMGNIQSTASNISWQLHSGSNATGSGPTQNGPLQFFSSASSGTTDYLKFHTSTAGPGPAVVFPALTIFNNTISASSNVSGAFFYGDGSNLINVPGGGGGIFSELNPSQAATTSSVAIGKATAPEGVFQVSGSLESGGNALVKISGDGGNDIFVVTGSGRVGIGTSTPAEALSVAGDISASTNISASSFSTFAGSTTENGLDIYSEAGVHNTTYGRQTITNNIGEFSIDVKQAGYGIVLDSADTDSFMNTRLNNNGVGYGGFGSGSYNDQAAFHYWTEGIEGAHVFKASRYFGENHDIMILDPKASGARTWGLTSVSGALSASHDISASAFHGDGSNLTGIGGGGIFTELNPSQAATTSSVAIGKATAPEGVFQVSGSLESSGNALVKVSGDGGNDIFVVTGSGRVGIGTAAPSRQLDLQGTSAAYMEFNATSHRRYTIGSEGSGFIIFDDTEGGTPGYRLCISDTAATLGYVGIGSGLVSPRAQLHVSSSLDFSNYGVLRVDGDAGANLLFVTGSGLVGIGTASPAATLTVAGSGSFSGSGGSALATSGRDVYFGNGSERSIGAVHVDFGGGDVADYLMVRNSGGGILLTGSGGVEIEGGGGEEGLLLVGTDLTVAIDDSDDAPINFTLAANSGDMYTSGSVGIQVPAGSPKLTLDVHYTGSLRPENLSNDTGGGEVVYFGSAGGPLTAGGLYFLDTNGTWKSANASVTGSGHNQLLGIALGAKPGQNGVLTKGYFDAHTYYSASFGVGKPVYIQSSSVARGATEGGFMSGAAPTAADSYVRVIGYGTDTANVIYFNPDATFVELG